MHKVFSVRFQHPVTNESEFLVFSSEETRQNFMEKVDEMFPNVKPCTQKSGCGTPTGSQDVHDSSTEAFEAFQAEIKRRAISKMSQVERDLLGLEWIDPK